MIAALLAAALVSVPYQSDDMFKKVLTDVCLPYANGQNSRAAAELLGFVVADETGVVVNMASPDENQAYLLRLTGDDDAEDGDDTRSCTLQARTTVFDSARSAIRRPLDQAGFAPEATQPANRPVWTRQGVTVSLRQSEGRATVMRVTYSSVEAGS